MKRWSWARVHGIVVLGLLLGVPLMFFLTPMLGLNRDSPGWGIWPGLVGASVAAAATTYALACAVVQSRDGRPGEAVAASLLLAVALGGFMGWNAELWANFCIIGCSREEVHPELVAGLLAAALQVGAGALARRACLKAAAAKQAAAASGPPPARP